MYQTYPYLANPTSDRVQGLDVGDDNVLLYLELTQPLPFPTEKALAYKANWTTPGISATMCIGSSVFFDSYLNAQHQATMETVCLVKSTSP